MRKILNGRDPATALYVGDNVDDALAAQGVPMPFVGILPRKSEERRQRGALLRKHGATTLLGDVTELEAWLEASSPLRSPRTSVLPIRGTKR